VWCDGFCRPWWFGAACRAPVGDVLFFNQRVAGFRVAPRVGAWIETVPGVISTSPTTSRLVFLDEPPGTVWSWNGADENCGKDQPDCCSLWNLLSALSVADRNDLSGSPLRLKFSQMRIVARDGLRVEMRAVSTGLNPTYIRTHPISGAHPSAGMYQFNPSTGSGRTDTVFVCRCLYGLQYLVKSSSDT